MASSGAIEQADPGQGPAWGAARWLAGTGERALSDDVIVATRSALIDWFACVIAGRDEPVTRLVAAQIDRYRSVGGPLLVTGGYAAAPFAALVHATAAHALDFDDTHIRSDAHFGGPTWAALSSIAGNTVSGADDHALCAAYAAGVQVGAKLAGRRLGHAMTARGWQATGLLGRLSAAAACTVIARLDAHRIAMALSLAATQTSGLTGSFGSMAKPLQGGKTAFDAVLASDLAACGVTGHPGIFEPGGGLALALVQDGDADIDDPDFDDGWEVTRVSAKAYPCLHGIHPTIDAARELAPRIAGREVAAVRAFVAPGVKRVAHHVVPRDTHEARFSVPYCAALGLLGRSAGISDFTDEMLRAPEVRAMLARVEVVPVIGRKMVDSAIEVTLVSGEVLMADVPMARGHPSRPLSRDELSAKFVDCAESRLGRVALDVLDLLGQFPAGDTFARALRLVHAQSPA